MVFVNLQAACITFMQFQELFGVAVGDSSAIKGAQSEAQAHYTVWKAMLDLQDHVIDWTTGTLLNAKDNSVRLV